MLSKSPDLFKARTPLDKEGVVSIPRCQQQIFYVLSVVRSGLRGSELIVQHRVQLLISLEFEPFFDLWQGT